MLYNSTTNNSLIIATSSIFNNRKISIEPKKSGLVGGTTYKIYPAIINKSSSTQLYYNNQSSWGIKAYTVPNVKVLSLSVKKCITIDFGVNSGRTWARKYDDGEGNYYVEFNVTIWHDSRSQITINSGQAVLRYASTGSSIQTINFLTSSTNVPNEKWINIGGADATDGFSITESQYNSNNLEVYIGIQGNLYGVVVPVTD